jgi:hypothetical protein
MKRCFKCGHKAYYRFSPDLDISGLGACKKHLEKVKMAYILLLSGKDLFDEITKDWWGMKDIEDTAAQQHDPKTGERL